MIWFEADADTTVHVMVNENLINSKQQKIYYHGR